jgi:hypothetical protein
LPQYGKGSNEEMNNMQNSNEESREEGVGTFSSTSKGLSENLKKTDKA